MRLPPNVSVGDFAAAVKEFEAGKTTADFLLEAHVEPAVVIRPVQDHRHPVVQRPHQVVGFGRQDGTRFDWVVATVPSGR